MVRERFIRVDEDSNGELWHVVYAVEVIDAEKRKENRLLYLSETDLMTGIEIEEAERKHREFLDQVSV